MRIEKQNYITIIFTVENCKGEKQKITVNSCSVIRKKVWNQSYSYGSYTNEHNTIFEKFEPT